MQKILAVYLARVFPFLSASDGLWCVLFHNGKYISIVMSPLTAKPEQAYLGLVGIRLFVILFPFLALDMTEFGPMMVENVPVLSCVGRISFVSGVTHTSPCRLDE